VSTETVRRLAALAAVAGIATFVWIAAATTTAPKPTYDEPADPIAVTPQTLDVRTELDLLGTSGATLNIDGVSEDQRVLPLSDGWIWNDSDFTFGSSVDENSEPPLWVRMRFSDGPWTLNIIAEGGVEIGRAKFDGITVVLVIDGSMFINLAGLCELVVHEAEIDRGARILQGSHRAVSAFGELSCTGIEEIRTGEPLSFSAAFKLSGS